MTNSRKVINISKIITFHKEQPMSLKRPPLILASSITPREMQWLWYPYIPSSAASLIFGPGGHGKSHISVDIAARLSTGRALPGQDYGGMPQRVLMLSAEDEFDVVLVPRLMRQGADLANIAFPKDPFTLDKDGIKAVEAYIHEFAATVVFIDPIVSYMGGKVDMNKANEVREFMGELHQMAIRTHSSVIIVGHSRKSRADDSAPDFEKAMGSVDFNNAVRSALYVTRANDGSRVMRHVKANYGPLGPSLGFEFGDGTFAWTGIVNEAGEMQAPVREQKKTKQVEWLRGVLSEGRVRADAVPALAKAAGYSMATINRVKGQVAESFMQFEDGKPVWYWTLRQGVEAKGDIDNAIQVQGLEDGGLAQGEAGRRQRVGRGVVRGAGAGDRGPVPRVAAKRQKSGVATVHAGPSQAHANDAKARAAQFLAQRGLA